MTAKPTLLQRIPRHVRYVAGVMALLLLVHALLRLAFLLYNSAQAHALPWGDFLAAMLVGMRYDVATVLLLNGALFLLLSLPLGFAQHPVTYRILNWLVLLVNLPAFAVNAVDIVYYSYAEKRLTHEIYTTGTDLIHFDPVIYFLDFWPVILFFLLMVAALLWVLRRLRLRVFRHTLSIANPRSLRAWAVPMLYFLVMAVGVRGGMQREWLNPSMAFVTGNFFAGNLGLNSAFTVIWSLDRKEEKLALVEEQEALAVSRQMVQNEFDVQWHSDAYPLYRRAEFAAPPRRHNVVVLLIESLNADMLGCLAGHGLTPTLDSLARAGRFYTHFFANGSRSVEAQPAVFSGLPDVFTRPTIGSRYLQNRQRGLAHILGEQGYTTAYYQGGSPHVLGLDQFAKAAGFQEFHHGAEMPGHAQHHDGCWGIFDQPYLQWMAQEQGRTRQPFLTAFFSCTNHHPFPLPAQGFEDLKAMDLTPQMRTVAYTDRALRSYFHTARQQPWFDSTLFVLTGDHCFYLESDPARPLPEQFHVPLILCGPGIQPGVDASLGSQVCILPTVIDHLRIDTWHASTGVSLLRSQPAPFAINSLMGVVSLSQGDACLSTRWEDDFSAFRLQGDEWRQATASGPLPQPLHDQMEHRLRCLYQQMQHCRVQDRWVPPGE